MGYGDVLLEGELFARPEDLVCPYMQISGEIFTVSDFEVHPLNTRLEAWVPAGTELVMLSLAVQMDGGVDQIEDFR